MRSTLFLLIVGLGGAAVLVALGIWQLQRLDWKQGILSQIESRIAAEPVAVPTNPLSDEDRYLPVYASGQLLPGALHVLISQKQMGAAYRLIAPFALDDGRKVMVDLGFIPVEKKDDVQPQGQLTLTGNLSWPSETDSFTPVPDTQRNIWFARDVGQMAQALNTEPVLIVARQVTPALSEVTPLPVDTAGIPNDHLNYAITWFSLAFVWLGMCLIFLRRQRGANVES